jgi:hypothetical protein
MIEPDKDWETWLHQRLRSLPDTRAPKNLIPEVLRKIAASKSRVWWKRPWLEWPAALQIVSASVFAAILTTAYWWQDSAILFVRQSAATELGRWTFLKATWTIAETMLDIGQYLVASITTPFLILAGALALTLYLAVVAIGALFCRVATEPS